MLAAVDAVAAAVAAKKIPMLQAAYRDLAAAPKNALAEHSAQIAPRLAALLSEMPPWHSAVYAVLVGALVEWNADAVTCAPPILNGLRDSLESAEFARLWQEKYGDEEDLPNPAGMPSRELQEELGPDYSTVWHTPYFGWLTDIKAGKLGL